MLAHSVLFAFVAVHATMPRQSSLPLELELLDNVLSPDVLDPDGRIVDTDDAKNRVRPNDTKNLAAYDQSVDREFKASGRLPSNAGTQASGEAGEPQSAPSNSVPNLSLADLGLSPDAYLSPGESTISGDLGGIHASDDYLPDVDEGPRTVLNAREYANWVFLNRIKKQLAPVWKRDIDKKVNSLYLSGRKLVKEEYITKVNAILDKKGALKEITLRSSSGSALFDDAAVTAFDTASPFPNPPRALLAADGSMVVHWNFVLKQGATQITFDLNKEKTSNRRTL